ncbi:unnamed protein product [Agarophyton chilense]
MSSTPKCDSISILVHPNDLRGATHNGLRKQNRFARRKCFQLWRRVTVEASPGLVRDTIFYAPYQTHLDPHPSITPTQFINISPNAPNVVRNTDQFEISFVAICASPQDTLACNNNELLLYSLTNSASASQPTCPPSDQSSTRFVNMQNGYLLPPTLANPPFSPTLQTQPVPLQKQSSLQKLSSLDSTIPPTLSSSPTDMPLIHYDPWTDGRNKGTKPNSYVPVPASMALYKQFNSPHQTPLAPDDQHGTSIRFNLLDIDRINQDQLQAISGITQLGQLVEKGAVAVPFAELVAHAFQAVAVVGKQSLRTYSAPDHVFSVDTRFRLADLPSATQQTDSINNTANYLRYGHYFFLEKSVDARLYSQTRSSSQYVPLLLRRTDLSTRKRRRNELEYFPLTYVSYVVLRVSPGCTKTIEAQKQAIFAEDKKRLDTVLQARNISEILSKERKNNHRLRSAFR